MRGHDKIIELRMQRKAPAMVFINDYPTKLHEDDHPNTVCTHGDVIQLLDLRFIVGLRVSIGSESEQRAKALMEACKNAGAKVVAACHILPNKRQWEQNGWSEIWRKETA